MVAALNGVFELDTRFKTAHTTGLFPKLRYTLAAHERPPKEGSFTWVVKPNDGNFTVKARFYTNGSRIDNEFEGYQRLG